MLYFKIHRWANILIIFENKYAGVLTSTQHIKHDRGKSSIVLLHIIAHYKCNTNGGTARVQGHNTMTIIKL